MTTRAVQNWEYRGKIVSRRTPTGRRYFTQEDVDRMLGKAPTEGSRSNVIYCRVSSRNQKDDLKNQKNFLRTFCNARGVIVEEVIEDIGSGLNYKRKKWLDLIWQVLDGQVDTVYITHEGILILYDKASAQRRETVC